MTNRKNPKPEDGAAPSTAHRYQTPLERWKALAKAENKAMFSGRSLAGSADETDTTPHPTEGKKADNPTRQRVVNLYYLARRGVRWISSETSLPMDEV